MLSVDVQSDAHVFRYMASHVAYLHIGIDRSLGIICIRFCLHPIVGNMHQRAHPKLHRTEYAAQPPHVLVFEIAAVAPAIHFHCESVLALMQIFCDVKLSRRHGVLTIPHPLAVDPYIHRRLHTAEMQYDVLRQHIVGGIEEGDVRTHGISPCICRPVLWRFT